MKFLYPSNMEAPPIFFLWAGRDALITFLSVPVSLVSTFWLHFSFPLVVTVIYGFMTIRFDDITIFSYISKLMKYFILQQQIFLWRANNEKLV